MVTVGLLDLYQSRGAVGQSFRGGLVFKAHRLVYHSNLDVGVMKEDIRRRVTKRLKGGGHVGLL